MFKRLLFNLHLRNSYPSYLTGLDGSKIPCNVIRTDGKSYDIKPDGITMLRKDGVATLGSDPNKPGVIQFHRYTPPKDQNV